MNDNSIKRFFNCAKEVSYLNQSCGNRQGVSIGSIIVYKGRIISSGTNSEKTSPLQKRLNKYRGFDTNIGRQTNHAEVNCITHVREDIDWSKAKLFIYREYKDGKPAMARCCPGCMQLVKSVGIRDIYYTTPNGWAKERIEY